MSNAYFVSVRQFKHNLDTSHVYLKLVFIFVTFGFSIHLAFTRSIVYLPDVIRLVLYPIMGFFYIGLHGKSKWIRTKSCDKQSKCHNYNYKSCAILFIICANIQMIFCRTQSRTDKETNISLYWYQKWFAKATSKFLPNISNDTFRMILLRLRKVK